jgi:hypothetical protein
MNEPTIKQWKRRALAAEQELDIVQKMRAFDATQEMAMARENAALRVALREVQDATNWAYGRVADKLGGVQ